MSVATSSPPPDDNTSLLQLLTEDWDETNRLAVQNSPKTSDYLARLTSLSLDELVREPMTLRTNQAQIKREAQQLTYTDYPAFLHAESCRRQLGMTLDSLDDECDRILNTTTPALEQACSTFLQQAKTIVEERTKMTKVLEHQHVLTDLLELPQLMDTCVWNGYYSEAMDLAAHVRLLQVRYPQLPVIDTIQTQVQATCDLMLIQLVSHLRQPIKLAAAMNVIGCLRRMDVFGSDRELRMVFLRCRHDCMQQRLEKIKKPSMDETTSQEAFDYLKRLVDVMREQMFEMATHYMSVFSNNNSQQDTLLADYMTRLVMQIQHTLQDHLVCIDDTSALASLLTQLQYCGMSLGRVGLDFRALFVQSFENALLALILRTMDQATELFIDTLHDLTITPSSHSSDDNTPKHPYQPPAQLVDYPSLAIFTNAILTCFNALRLLPAISLFDPVKLHLDTCLVKIAQAMKLYCDQILDSTEISLVESFVAAYCRCCVPFLSRCLVEGIFGNVMVQGDDTTVDDVLKDYLVSVELQHGLEDDQQEQTDVVDEEQQGQTDVVDEQQQEQTDVVDEQQQEQIDVVDEQQQEQIDVVDEQQQEQIDVVDEQQQEQTVIVDEQHQKPTAGVDKQQQEETSGVNTANTPPANDVTELEDRPVANTPPAPITDNLITLEDQPTAPTTPAPTKEDQDPADSSPDHDKGPITQQE